MTLKDPELDAAVVEALGLEDAEPLEVWAIIRAAEPLWDELARLGKTDAFGGMEFRRVFPVALKTICAHANAGADQ
jgi:hypothetical protein